MSPISVYVSLILVMAVAAALVLFVALPIHSYRKLSEKHPANKKTIKLICIAVPTVIIMSLCVRAGIGVYNKKYKKEEIDRSVSDDGEYTVVFYKVGETFLSGPAKVRLTVENDGKVI